MNRRQFLKSVGTAIPASLFSANSFGKTGNNPPNIIFIICDQMRADAMSCTGNNNAHTPNLDRLAGEGVRFENGFANNPVCAPSRVTCFTGLLPHEHGQLTNTSGRPMENLDNSMLGFFKKKGYRLGWFGKNHTLKKELFDQLDSAEIRARESFRAYSKYVPPFWHGDTLWPEEQCNPRKNTDDAIQFLESNSSNKPFFLHVSYFDPHPPYMAPSEFSSKYCSAEITIPEYIEPPAPRLKEQQKALHYDKMSKADLKETMRYYHASVEWGVDFQVGRLMDAIKKNGLEENTIVLFTSDHGDFMGEYNMVRKGMFLYDALLHVPFIVWAPGRIRQGIVNPVLVQHTDIFPTLADMATGEIPINLSGRSLMRFLQGETKDDPDYAIVASARYNDLPENYWDNPEPAFDPTTDKPFHSRVEDRTWNPEKNTIMARTLEWKLIKDESRSTELYHLNGGYKERENIAENPQYAAIRNKLEKIVINKWKW